MSNEKLGRESKSRYTHSVTFQRQWWWIGVILCGVFVISPSCKKLTGKFAPHDHSSEAKRLSTNGFYGQLAYDIKNSLKPGEIVITYDDGPAIRHGGACDEREALSEESPPPSGSSIPAKREDSDHSPLEPPESEEQPSMEYVQTISDAKLDSSDLVDFLVAKNIPATFFVVGLKYASPGSARCVIDRIVKASSLTLANHTWSHISSVVHPKECNKSTSPVILKGGVTEERPSGDSEAYSKFISEEVKAAHCLIRERVYEVIGESQSERARQYPLFFRPPGGYWEENDQRYLVDDSQLQNYLGPVPWYFGGNLSENHAADYSCWEAGKWWNGASEKKREAAITGEAGKERKYPLSLLNLLKEGKSIVQACSELYVKSIMRLPLEKRKGIVLLHDEHAQTVEMSIKYLLPALVAEESLKIIPLSDVPYFADQIAQITGDPNPPLTSQANGSAHVCERPVNHCTCCTPKDRSCCRGASPPPLP